MAFKHSSSRMSFTAVAAALKGVNVIKHYEIVLQSYCDLTDFKGALLVLRKR